MKKQQNDFLNGSILPSLLRFAGPVLLALFLQAMYGAVDLIVVGKSAGTADISAVSTGSQAMQLVTSLLVGLTTGVTVLLGQKIGEGKPDEAGSVIGSAICLFVCVALGLTVLLVTLAAPFCRLLQAPEEAFDPTAQYVRICSAGTLFIVAFNVIGSVFRGLGDSKMPLITVAIACVVNIFGDLLLVAVFHLGAAGAALATVFAQAISVVLSLLVIDFSQLSARRMLNIDSEDEGIFTVSCAGGASANVSVGLTMAPNAAPCAKLTVSGLIGGHSGQEINKGRANANILLGRVLDALVQKLPVRLVSAAGGRKDNAIPNAAEAVLALAEGDLPAAKQIAAACTADLRKEYAVADPGVTVTLEEAAVCPQALTEEATLRVVRYLLLVPNGIAAMSMDIPGLVQTSCNLGIFQVADGVLTAVSSVRSSVASQKQMLLARFAALSQLLGGSLQVTGAYPAWEYRRESVLREKMAAVYEKQTGRAPKIEAIHAGLECGLFAGQLPGLDCVSFGPDLVDIHTAREKMSISSVQRTWKFLLGVLEALKD